jgi:phasin family protein
MLHHSNDLTIKSMREDQAMSTQIAAATRMLEDATAQSRKALEDIAKAGQEQTDKVSQSVLASFDDLTRINEANYAAVVKASQTFARGVEEITHAMAAYGRKSMEDGLLVTKKLIGAGTVTELAEIQSAYVQTSVAALVAETEKLSQLVSKVLTESVTPINERVSATVEQIAKPLAA